LKFTGILNSNPVRAGIVSNPKDYRWSSYRSNALGNVSDLCTPHPEYLNLGRDSDKRRKNYRELFKHHFSDTVLEQIRKATNKGMIVGNDRFREEIEALRAMEILKSTNRAPDFSLFSRRVNGRWNMYTLTQRGKQVKRQAVW
jgi:hypothetical protein